MVFSTNIQRNHLHIQPISSQPAKVNVQKDSKEPRIRSRTLRFSNRRFHRPYRRNHLLENTGSFSADRLDNAERYLQLHLQLHCQNSDSNNSASAEASSESINRYLNFANYILTAIRRISSKHSNYHDGDRKRHRKRVSRIRLRQSSYSCLRKIRVDSLRNVTPFTKSLLQLATVFLQEFDKNKSFR
ncbi:uncharacterized protein LOC113561761 [Ooceraea biroi]|uniref:uncharacterized protein LOC113561761 n=1 Tax=Ooceraea biroi TaxID=2015173 RepID=UPI000F083AAE|nr:uncharacterized protein LOC113561761 [Ooceraea biroi]